MSEVQDKANEKARDLVSRIGTLALQRAGLEKQLSAIKEQEAKLAGAIEGVNAIVPDMKALEQGWKNENESLSAHIAALSNEQGNSEGQNG